MAVKLGRPERYVRQRLKLQDLCEEGRELMVEGRMNFAQALELVKYSGKIQSKFIERHGSYACEWTALRIREQLSLGLQLIGQAPWDLGSITLLPSAGTCAECPKRSDAMAGLFPELADEEEDGPQCMDSLCWQTKGEAWADQAWQVLKDQGHAEVRTVKLDEFPSWAYDCKEERSEGAIPVVFWPGTRHSMPGGGIRWYAPKEAGAKDADPDKDRRKWEAKVQDRYRLLLEESVILMRPAVSLIDVLREIVARDRLYKVRSFAAAEVGVKDYEVNLENFPTWSEPEWTEKIQAALLSLTVTRDLEEEATALEIDLEQIRAQAELDVPKPKKLIALEKEAATDKVVEVLIKKRRGRPAKAKAAAEVGS